ncbi:unnamed protein product [Cylicocyclus nassatus]|uniref:Uncharacterized protein n=1 Tax=Cylicocyclus nassatus TaxID=53992 RepID=A0AA36DS28_CYLNA|nr:unnamed protein product [Cylicocyclus nassatus]
MDDAADVGVVVSAFCDFDLVAKSPLYGKLAGRRGSETLAASDEHLRKTVDKVTHSCRHVEVKKEQTEMKVESEVVVVSQQVVHQEESDAEPCGSVTPMRTDGEDNDKWSTSDNQSAGGRIMSPGRGRGNELHIIDTASWLLIESTCVKRRQVKKTEMMIHMARKRKKKNLQLRVILLFR